MNRVLWLICAFTLALPANAQTDGLPNSICNTGRKVPRTDYWQVDSNLPTQLNGRSFGTRNLSYNDLLNAVDQALQGVARQSRAEVRHRVKATPATCTVTGSSDPCIVGLTNAQDNTCAQNTGVVAHAGCSDNDGNGCHVVFCLTNIDNQNSCQQSGICSRDGVTACTSDANCPDVDLDWTSDRSMIDFLHHEFGHNFGLQHPNNNNGTPLCPNAPGTPCSSHSQCNNAFCVNGICTTSDGCDGEQMCTSLGASRSGYFERGDVEGLRHHYNANSQYLERRVFSGSRVAETSNAPTIDTDILGHADFAPRIDCATWSNSALQCAAVWVNGATQPLTFKVNLLRNWSTSGWGTVAPLLTTTGQAALPPDIAVQPDGSAVYVATTSLTNNNNVFVWRVNTSDGSVVAIGMGYRATIPPRIAWNEDIDAPILLSAQSVGPETGALRRGPRWRMDRINFSGGNLSAVQLNAGFLDNDQEAQDRHIASDYDFDCRNISTGSHTCVIVAALYDDTNTARQPGFIASIRFTVSSSNVVTLTPSSDWTFSNQHDAQAVIGVALTTDRVVLSEGRRTTSSTSNTRVAEYCCSDVAAEHWELSVMHKSDAEACDSAEARGETLAAATPHGGYDMSMPRFRGHPTQPKRAAGVRDVQESTQEIHG